MLLIVTIIQNWQMIHLQISNYSKTCLKRPLKKKSKKWVVRPIIASCRSKVLQNAPRGHYVILLTFIKLPFVIKIFVVFIFKWPLKEVLVLL